MVIGDIGINTVHGNDFEENRPNGMGFWLLLIVKTAGWFSIDGKVYEVKKPAYVVLRPNTPVIYRALRGDLLVTWVVFKPERNDVERMQGVGIRIDMPVYLSSYTEAEDLIGVANYEHYMTDEVHLRMESHLMATMFLLLVRYSKDSGLDALGMAKGKAELLNDLRVRIYSHPDSIGTIEEIAEELSLSRSSLQHMYKKLFGTPISSDVILSRVGYAKKLLGSTKYNLREIARRCGYQNEFYFMRQFRESVGMTPSEYRKTL